MASKYLDITGRVAVVIGGTSGIGRALAVGLAEAGANVVPTGRRMENINEVCDLIGQPLRHTVDVTYRASIDGLRDAVMEKHGRVDILFNVAGRTIKKPTVAITEDDWETVMDTNLTGVLRACQSFYEPLKASGRGRIVNIASLSSFVSLYQTAAYNASKSALMSLTKTLAVEWARDSICVNALVPGVFRTDLNSNLLDSTPRGQEFLMRTPMKRFGKIEELIGAGILLSSDGASFITGEGIAVDGGFLCSGVNA